MTYAIGIKTMVEDKYVEAMRTELQNIAGKEHEDRIHFVDDYDQLINQRLNQILMSCGGYSMKTRWICPEVK